MLEEGLRSWHYGFPLISKSHVTDGVRIIKALVKKKNIQSYHNILNSKTVNMDTIKPCLLDDNILHNSEMKTDTIL